jgi:hypothetical protein
MIVELDRAEVKALFETHDHQSDVAIALYRMVYPNWDKIKSVDGYPKCSEQFNKEMFRMFRDFDRRHHPDVMASGLWMNNGFSSLDSDITDDKEDKWKIQPAEVTLLEDGTETK